jgi:hypothetical protein
LLCIFAFATIFVTTGDDAVWLVPYFSRRYSASARLLHGVAFVLALQVCVWTSYLLVVIFGNALDASATNARLSRALGFEVTSTALMAVVAAAVAWLIAAVLLIKACLKARRKSSTIVKVEEARLESYGAVAIGSKDGAEVVERLTGDGGAPRTAVEQLPGAPLAVFGFALLGAIDESLYFPSLLLGRTFTVWQLAVGAAAAALLMIALVSVARALACCMPLLDCFDRLPLWGVVALFATILSLDALLDIDPQAVARVEADAQRVLHE